MPNHSPEEIIRMVDRMERERSDLQDRMDRDFDRYTLKSYQGEIGEDGEDLLAGYTKFTANDPQTTMNLALHLGSTARRIVRVHQPRAQRMQREIDNQKEMFCLGILSAADERRHNLKMPSLQDSLFGQNLFRGRWAQRVLLVKEEIEDAEREDQIAEERTRTYVDVTDWDPRNTYWGLGKHGLAWACNKAWKSRDAILEEWDVDPQMDSIGRRRRVDGGVLLDGDHDEMEFAIYDWFDETDNIVVLEGGRVLKRRTPHGMGRVPVSLGMAGSIPLFQAHGEDYDVYYGESFYKADRNIFDQANFMYSIMAELSKRSIKQPLIIKSPDGSLTLPGDPRVTGSETSITTEDSIEELPPMEMVREAGTFMGIISGMMQRGTFPSSAFGELAFQLSGFAITQLRQGLEAPLTPHIRAGQQAFKEILDILCDAYASGNFDAMELSGRLQDPQRTYFSTEIFPENVKNGGQIEVEVVAQLPQDDASKMSLAQLAREAPNGVPLLNDRFIREHILSIQDVEQVERAVWEQVAESGSPIALAFKSMMAAAQQGEQELAEIWFSEFQIQFMQKFLETMQLMSMGASPQQGENGVGRTPAQTGLPSPEVMPPQMAGRGGAPNPAAATAGAQGNAGQPRPGAIRNSSQDVMGF